MKTYKLSITGKVLGYNQCHNMHWAKRRAIKKEWQEMTAWLAKAKEIPRLKSVSLTFELHFKDEKKRDIDNYSMSPAIKGITDGLVLAGVIEDDSKDYVKERIVKFGEEKKDMVILHIRGE